MRIAVINWNRRVVGGVESYLNGIIPELQKSGHELAFWSEIDEPQEREQVNLPDGVESWCASSLGEEQSLQALREWQPNLLFVHKLTNPRLEAKLQIIARSLLFAHDYTGMCVSGAKAFKSPTFRPCERKLGWKCLAHYYPRRCGGLNPLTMIELYNAQRKRQDQLTRYDGVLTVSPHLARELANHGVDPKRIHCLPPPVTANIRTNGNGHPPVQIGIGNPASTQGFQLLFLGRMDQLKGGQIFLEALPEVQRNLQSPLRILFVGDGPELNAWKRAATKLQNASDNLQIDFSEWKKSSELSDIWKATDLLVLPSLWPEPFGLVGLEAASHSVPVAAFDVGGISTWLKDGVNGHLAPGNPPTASGLAQAISKCLMTSDTRSRLSTGATRLSSEFGESNHVTTLLDTFERVFAGTK